MKHVLVPVDFSEDSVNALEMAIAFANEMGHDVRMIHVIKDAVFYQRNFSLTNLIDVKNETVINNLKKLVEQYKPKAHHNLDFRIRSGKVYNEIANQAKYGEAELIVIGSHGTSGFEELWLGSNAYKVVNNSPCPVLSLRNSYKRHQINRIVLPIDDTPETRQKIPYTARIAKEFNAEVHLLQVADTKKENVLQRINDYANQVARFLENNDIDYLHEAITGNNLTDITIDYALRKDADLISIMTEQSESTKNIWLGPYAQQMVNHSPIPVLSIQPY
ncbi:universal stress protein [Salinivirga cyanobacteriivorans]|uniref:Universal stress protein UspE n=1 Tax=Salinivirga cyanobacteriivorans TaxID=1307839 RepID=A0A0S2HYS2_9BACT|nr:universal stress protein [Salinivirga cyanobacteriivorans]ALO15179.1 universal stress protein UspE [Salinivirga cyanobacteriivorans]